MGYINLILFIVSVAVLFYSGGLLVRSLTILGRYFRLSEYVLSFILVAFATSLPELFVGLNSALQGAPLLSLGNIIGANVLNITLVLGIAIIFAGGLNVERPMKEEDYFFVLGIIIVPVLFIFDGVIGRLEGGILLVFFLGYVIYLVQTSHKKNIVNDILPGEATPAKTITYFILFLFGATLLLGSSSFVVYYSINAARNFSLPLFLVGILISVGTTLPEVIFSFKSVTMKHGSMSIGNVLGSIVFNITLITGLVAVISPIVVENVFRAIFGMSLTILLVVIIQSVGFIKGRLGYRLGVGLVLIAFLFVMFESLIK